MPSLTIPILPDGAFVTFIVAVTAARRTALASAGQAVPNPVVGMRGLIDTGASGTLIHTVLIQSLGLMPTGSVAIHMPTTGSTPMLLNSYDVALGIAMDKKQTTCDALDDAGHRKRSVLTRH